MPIKNYDAYGGKKAWRIISERIRFGRAKGKCEKCDAVHLQRHPITGSKVVLTVAHIDQNPSNHNESNLLALCQRCHFALDKPFNIKKRKQTNGNTPAWL